MLLTAAPTLARVGSPRFLGLSIHHNMLLLLQSLFAVRTITLCCCCYMSSLQGIPYRVAETPLAVHQCRSKDACILHTANPVLLCNRLNTVVQEVNQKDQRPVDVIKHKKKLEAWFQVQSACSWHL